MRLLAVIDEYTRECPATEVARSFTAQDVTSILQYLFAVGRHTGHRDNRPAPDQRFSIHHLPAAAANEPLNLLCLSGGAQDNTE